MLGLKSLLLLLISVSLLAQTPPAEDEQSGEETQEEEAVEVQVSQIEEFLRPFYYVVKGQRDPFEEQTLSVPLRPGPVYGPFLPSQSYRLRDFKLKGLLWQTNSPVAIFEAPGKKTFRLGIKDYIGENFGYIASIREKEVVIIQTIEEQNKRYSTTKVVFLD